jgi:hypothetical protein
MGIALQLQNCCVADSILSPQRLCLDHGELGSWAVCRSADHVQEIVGPPATDNTRYRHYCSSATTGGRPLDYLTLGPISAWWPDGHSSGVTSTAPGSIVRRRHSAYGRPSGWSGVTNAITGLAQRMKCTILSAIGHIRISTSHPASSIAQGAIRSSARPHRFPPSCCNRRLAAGHENP